MPVPPALRRDALRPLPSRVHPRPALFAALAALGLLPACRPARLAEPEPCARPVAPDLDPDPNVVEVALTAAPSPWDPGNGTTLLDGLAYEGSVPGPVIEVELGQTLRVRFTNGLESATTIHWHGLRVPPAMDGAVRMEEMVEPGATFVYEFPIRDAGFYWFHPHMATERDLERGLYGTIVVRRPGEPRLACDLPIALDDLLLDDDGQIAANGSAHRQIMGRLGNLLLANGRTGSAVAVTAGETTLLRLVNTANARIMDIGLEGQRWRLVATDGGWLAEAQDIDRLVLAPGERAILALEWAGATGDRFRLLNRRFRLHENDSEMSESDPLGDGENAMMEFVVTAEGGEAVTLPGGDDLGGDDPPRLLDPSTTGHRWILDEDMEAGIVTLDGGTFPDVPVVTVPGPALTAFEVQNDSEMHHPFHLHGNRFQVVGVDGVAPPYVGWKDTVQVPPGSTIRFVGELDNVGEWMVHCHILEHAELGMAGFMRVE